MNRKAFAEQYEKHKHRLVCGLIGMTRNREMAEDIASAAFASAFEKLDSFRGEASFYTWLYCIAVHELVTYHRRNRIAEYASIDHPDAAELADPDLLSQVLDRAECCARLRRILRRIPTIYRQVLVDHFVRRRPTKLIAKRHRIPLGTVLSRIFTAKRLLRAAWEA
jgi:RNA polymerase sigma-70 factor, ECF subfamily